MIWNSSSRTGAIKVSKSSSMKPSNPSIFMNGSYLIIFPIYSTVIDLFKFSISCMILVIYILTEHLFSEDFILCYCIGIPVIFDLFLFKISSLFLDLFLFPVFFSTPSIITSESRKQLKSVSFHCCFCPPLLSQ